MLEISTVGCLVTNFKLNKDKTELLVISSKYWPRPSLDSILVGDHRVNRSDKARNIGVAFDETLSLDTHLSSVCKSPLLYKSQWYTEW